MPALLFIIGCIFGSFINVVLSRGDWYRGRSRCDTCGYTLKWYDLIPIFSFCLLRGKCRKCHDKVDILHLASEIYMGCGFMAAAHYYQHNVLEAICMTTAILFLGIFAVSDTKETAVSVLYLYGGLFCIALLRIVRFLSTGDLYGAIIFAAVYSMVYFGFLLAAKRFRDHIGEGDFDIFMLILMAVGFFNTMVCITIASVIGTCLYLPLIIRKKCDREKPIPLAPLLYVGFVITILGGI